MYLLGAVSSKSITGAKGYFFSKTISSFIPLIDRSSLKVICDKLETHQYFQSVLLSLNLGLTIFYFGLSA